MVRPTLDESELTNRIGNCSIYNNNKRIIIVGAVNSGQIDCLLALPWPYTGAITAGSSNKSIMNVCVFLSLAQQQSSLKEASFPQ